MNGNSIFLH